MLAAPLFQFRLHASQHQLLVLRKLKLRHLQFPRSLTILLITDFKYRLPCLLIIGELVHELLSFYRIKSSLTGQAFHSCRVVAIVDHVILAQYLARAIQSYFDISVALDLFRVEGLRTD